MSDRSNGSVCPFPGLDSAGRVSSHSDNPHPPSHARSARMARPCAPKFTRAPSSAASTSIRSSRAKLRRRTWIERAGSTTAATPMWTSRTAWLNALQLWATDAVIKAVATRLGCSITAATVLQVAAAMADYADHATGRHVAVTRATLADRIGCSQRTVTTAWKVLKATGWALEASRGHGGPRTPAFGRRPSVWHLTPRRRAVELFHLPPLSRESGLSPERSYSPTARARAAAAAPRKRQHPARTTPRPLALQKLADELVGNAYGRPALCHGLHRGHIGSVCDALTAAGIDPERWTGAQLKRELDLDAQRTHWSWPNRIDRPGAFLVGRLRRVVAAGATPVAPVVVTEVPVQAAEQIAVNPPAQRSTIAAAQTILRVHLADRRARRAAAQAIRHDQRSLQPDVCTVAESGSCARCDAPDAPRRAHMPAGRAHICQACWLPTES